MTKPSNKATMFPLINKIRKLRSYRQERLGRVYKPLITKDITMGWKAHDSHMSLKKRHLILTAKDSRVHREGPSWEGVENSAGVVEKAQA